MTINEAGKKKTVPKLQAFAMALVARSFHDKAARKDLLNWLAKLPKEAFDDEKFYGLTQYQLDLFERIEQDAATWQANSSEATNIGASSPD